MLDKIASALRNHCGVPTPGPLVVGVSGGPDSLCLMHGLHQLGYQLTVAHLDHALRPESAQEASTVRTAASALGLECLVERIDVRGFAVERGLSIEEAARDRRYRFLFNVARTHGAVAVAVGHTADDQAETLLMHLIRGAGLDGLSGMSYRTVLPLLDPQLPVIRPLLALWRADITAYCEENSLEPSFDASNESKAFFRNRIRHELIPMIESMNPEARRSLWRAAQSLALDRQLISERVETAWGKTVIRATRDFVGLDASGLGQLSIPLQRRLIREAVRHLDPAVDIGYAALERASSFIADSLAPVQDLVGGLVLVREPPLIYVARGADRLPRDMWPQLPDSLASITVPVPGRISLADKWYLETDITDRAALDMDACLQDGFLACIDAAGLSPELELRPQRRGDRFEPLGLDGHSQKVADFFANVKMPERARGRWPLLCAGPEVIWVPGYRLSESRKIRPSTARVVRVTVGYGAPAGEGQRVSGSAVAPQSTT